MTPAPAPLIVTALMDEISFAWFDALRRAHFPRDRNIVPAHLTLFHKLPGEEEAAIASTLKTACARIPPLVLQVRGPWSIGRGVAYRLASPGLEALRRGLVETFDPWLAPQDRAPWRPHVTVQNKADPVDAKVLLQELQHAFEPFEVTARGLQVWRYLGGPWGPVAAVPFTGAA